MTAERNIKILAWFNFFTDFKLYHAIAIIYFTRVTGSFALGMSIYSVASIAVAVFEIPTGVFSDMIGRRQTVIFGAFFAVIYSIFYAIGSNYWILFIGALLQGLSVAFYSGNNDALLHDSLTEIGRERQYHEYLGKLKSLFQAALAIGAILGSILITQSFTIVMWLSVFPQLICLLLSFLLVEPKIHIEKSTNVYIHLKDAVKLFKTNKKLRLISISGSLGGALGEAMYQFQAAFYNLLWPLWAVGLAKTLSNIGAMISYYYSGSIINRFNEIVIVLAGNIYSRIIYIFSVLIPTPISPILISSTSLTYGATDVAKNSLLQKEFTPHQRATIASLNSLLESVLFAVIAFFLGLIGDKIGPAMAILLLQFVFFIATYLYWQVYKGEKITIKSTSTHSTSS